MGFWTPFKMVGNAFGTVGTAIAVGATLGQNDACLRALDDQASSTAKQGRIVGRDWRQLQQDMRGAVKGTPVDGHVFEADGKF